MPKPLIFFAAVAAALLLAGCAGYGATDREALTNFRAAGRTIGKGPDYIDVEASYRSFVHRVDKIELVAADGARLKAPEVATVVEADDGGYGGGRYGSIGVGGGSGGVSHFGVGISLGWLLNGSKVDPAPRVRAKATILVPDPAAYRKEWKKWRIAVTVSRKGAATEELTVPAPAP